MGYGKSKESAAQERKNLLGINPIADHASGSWMSKHSIAGGGSTSPLHSGHNTDPKKGPGFEGAPTTSNEPSFWNKVKTEGKKFKRSWDRATKPTGQNYGGNQTSRGFQNIYTSDIDRSIESVKKGVKKVGKTIKNLGDPNKWLG